jgi:parvulin-like peptidyl-prolyl isomerase
VTPVPVEIANAAFALGEVGSVSPPVRSQDGFHILKMTARRPAVVQPIANVTGQIQERLVRERRKRAAEELGREVRARINPTIDEARLKAAQLGGGPAR